MSHLIWIKNSLASQYLTWTQETNIPFFLVKVFWLPLQKQRSLTFPAVDSCTRSCTPRGGHIVSLFSVFPGSETGLIGVAPCGRSTGLLKLCHLYYRARHVWALLPNGERQLCWTRWATQIQLTFLGTVKISPFEEGICINMFVSSALTDILWNSMNRPFQRHGVPLMGSHGH